jgi:hypothetical protein
LARELAIVGLLAPSVFAGLPTIDRAVVDRPSAWARAVPPTPAPRRVFRPARTEVEPYARTTVVLPRERKAVAREQLADRIATLAGASAARWGLGDARSSDPARALALDQAWLVSSAHGGAFLDRFAIAFAVVPRSLVFPRGLSVIDAPHGDWTFVELPVAPPASVMTSWISLSSSNEALARLFPSGGGPALDRGVVVLDGVETAVERAVAPPRACSIETWQPGAIALECTSDRAGYAVVASAADPGWTVHVGGAEAPWLRADAIRRAVAIAPGSHRIEWSYRPPGVALGALLAALGLAGVVALAYAARRRT